MSETRKKILIVDDEPDIVKTTSIMLDLEGYEIIAAVSGEDAIEKIRIDKPDLIILDVVLPGINGKEITLRLKEDSRYKNIPIILITAQTQRNELEKLKKLPADFCLTKPFDSALLTLKVKELLGLSQ
ncbi:MAG: response regulator, partial [Candidatus Omnitrophica bacterium]|nr:response regulator [Candidatus Omnitrophota bacterium]